MHIYRPQRSWGKVMFLHVCVILFRVGGLPQCMLGYPPGSRHPPGAGTPLGADPPRRPAARHAGIAPLLRSACWEKRSTSGRYASHWNAILVMDVVSRWHPDKYNLFKPWTWPNGLKIQTIANTWLHVYMKGEYSRNIHTTDWQTLLEIVFTFSCTLKYLSKFIFFTSCLTIHEFLVSLKVATNYPHMRIITSVK